MAAAAVATYFILRESPATVHLNQPEPLTMSALVATKEQEKQVSSETSTKAPTTAADAATSSVPEKSPPKLNAAGNPILTQISTSSSDILNTALKGNAHLFTLQERELLLDLVRQQQSHLFAHWPAPGDHDEDKHRQVDQLMALNSHYPGGLIAYIGNAKRLLEQAVQGVNPFDGLLPEVPLGERLDFAAPDFIKYEDTGVREAAKTAFVLVAGGLGERLGYSGIKVALPYQTATGMCFLELYCQHIAALQRRAGNRMKLPFAIMTSDDTHSRTLELLKTHKYFGLDPTQVTLMKQEKVACLSDSAARLAAEPSDPYSVQTKPHGHGDVHALLYRTGLARTWEQKGIKWVAFFQDTNALVFRALVAALGVSAAGDYDMNSLCVPRKAGEAIGAIARLRNKVTGEVLTTNVEYNQLDPLLRATVNPHGDVNDETGWSPFPGNINQLIMKVSSYVPTLEASGGVIAEFVNPKFTDSSRTAFKSSTRLECMMQDYPKMLPSSAKVGFTIINQVWATYSPVKNSVAEARAKVAAGGPSHSATAGECDVYKANCEMLEILGAVKQLHQPEKRVFNGISVDLFPRVVLDPSFLPAVKDTMDRFGAGSVVLHDAAVLCIGGADVRVESLEVDGALVVKAVPGAKVVIRGLKVANKGWEWVALDEAEKAPEELKMRGFKVVKHETRELVFDSPGEYVVSE